MYVGLFILLQSKLAQQACMFIFHSDYCPCTCTGTFTCKVPSLHTRMRTRIWNGQILVPKTIMQHHTKGHSRPVTTVWYYLHVGTHSRNITQTENHHSIFTHLVGCNNLYQGYSTEKAMTPRGTIEHFSNITKSVMPQITTL